MKTGEKFVEFEELVLELDMARIIFAEEEEEEEEEEEARIVVSLKDITDRKQAEEDLRKKSHLNQTLLDAFPCVALLLRPQTREIIASNNAAVKVGALPGTHCFSTWGQRQDPCPWCLAPALWATGEAQHLEVESLGIFWDAHWIPVAEDLYMHFAFDITERKRAEEALKESEERYRQLLENAPAGIYEIDLTKGRMLSVNDVMCKYTGYTRDELLATNALDFLTGESQKLFMERMADLASGKPVPATIEFQARSKSGREFWTSLNIRYLYNEGVPVRATVVAHDVTDRKRSEEELRASRQQLRALAERIHQVREEEKILISRDIHDTMGGGLTGLKMDINWLMHNVKKAESDNEQAALMERFLSANENIDNMIKVTRRISTGLRPPVLDDLGLIAALEWQLSDLTSRSGIPYELATAFEYVSMEKDKAVAMFRIFQETLTNVIRHSGATKVVIILREDDERSLFGDENLVLEIRDNGRGITEEEILNKESLGLLGMKERAMVFGGEFSIRGEPGGGTTVVLKIPKKQGEQS